MGIFTVIYVKHIVNQGRILQSAAAYYIARPCIIKRFRTLQSSHRPVPAPPAPIGRGLPQPLGLVGVPVLLDVVLEQHRRGLRARVCARAARCAAVRLSPRGRHCLSSLTHSRLAKARRHSFSCLGWCCHRLSRQVFVRRHRSEGGTLA